MEFQLIQTREDTELFLKKTNSLHDSYVIGVQYINNAITNKDENGYFVDPDAKKLTLRILVTSICDTVIEIVFDGVLEWQIKEDRDDIMSTSVTFNDQGLIVWSEDDLGCEEELKNGSYVIATSMKWRITK